MANPKIRLKRTNLNTLNDTKKQNLKLSQGEPLFDLGNNLLYIGKNSTDSKYSDVTPINELTTVSSRSNEVKFKIGGTQEYSKSIDQVPNADKAGVATYAEGDTSTTINTRINNINSSITNITNGTTLVGKSNDLHNLGMSYADGKLTLSWGNESSKTCDCDIITSGTPVSGTMENATRLTCGTIGTLTKPTYFVDGKPVACSYELKKTVPADAVFTDTKNTAGSTNTSNKIFLIGATTQAADPQTYSHDTVYVGTDGYLYNNGEKVLTAHQTVTNKSATLSWGATSTIATVGGTNITVKMPANPDTNTHYTTKLFATSSTGTAHSATTNGNTYLRLFDDNTACQSIKITGSGGTTVTSDASGVITINSNSSTNTAHSHSAGAGLTMTTGSGGISGTTTYAANLNSTSSLGTLGTTSKLYAVGIDANNKLCVKVPWTDNNAYHTSGSWSGLTYTATANGGAGELTFTIPTGKTSTTVARGDHTHSGYASSGHTHSGYATSGHSHYYAASPSIGGGASSVIIYNNAGQNIGTYQLRFDGINLTFTKVS